MAAAIFSHQAKSKYPSAGQPAWWTEVGLARPSAQLLPTIACYCLLLSVRVDCLLLPAGWLTRGAAAITGWDGLEILPDFAESGRF